jgi:CheY-like chemotaxis protein
MADGEDVQPDAHGAFARVSHEVRTTLAAIAGYAELLERADSAGDMRASASQIAEESRRLVCLLDAALSSAEEVERGERPARRVLHVEDDPANVRLVYRLLSRCVDVDVTAATSVAEGIDLARSMAPDVIILDLHLDDGSGVQVLDALEADDALRHVPVITTSADGPPPDTEQRWSMVRGHLTKPMDLDDFDRTMRRVLQLPPSEVH